MFYPCNSFIRNRVYPTFIAQHSLWENLLRLSLEQAKNELITGLAYHLEIR